MIGERRTTPIELLWDLVFVFAVTQVTTLLSADLSWAGFGRAMLVLALVWWAWSAFVWATNAQDPEAAVFRGVLLLATALIFVAGLALPHAFGRDGTLFAVAYAGVRMLHLALYVDASRRGNASLAAIAGFATTVAIGMALLVTGSFAGGSLRDDPLSAAARLTLCGGVALYLIGHVAFRLRMVGLLNHAELAAAAAALVVFVASAGLAAWAAAGVLTLVLMLLVARETVAERPHPERVPG